MKQLLILITLMIVFSTRAFAFPSLAGIPEDRPSESEVNRSPAVVPADRAHQLKKEVEFIKLGHYSKKLVKEMNSNVIHLCHEEDPRIIGFKTFAAFLIKKEQNEMLKLNQVNNTKNCQARAFACSLNGSALKALSTLIHDPFFVEYLVDQKKWPEESAQRMVDYFTTIESSVRPQP